MRDKLVSVLVSVLLAQFGGLEIHFENAEANDSRGLSRRLGLRGGCR
jgi:hypothetical protein